MRAGIHAGSPDTSSRLRLTLEALYAAGAAGLTSLELQERARLVAPGTCVSELRAAGWVVNCRYEGKVDGRKRYRYVLIGRKDSTTMEIVNDRHEAGGRV